MSINIPIVTDFDGRGIKKAVQQFKELETTGQKAQFALKKAAVPAAAALGALTVAMGDAVKAAMEDEKSQQMLARQLRATTGATDDQIKSVEKYITAQGRNLGITDDQLRPALAGLVRVTKDVNEAQNAASLAADIAAAKGISLEQASKAVERAYGGQLQALGKLDPSVREMIKGGATLEEVFAKLQGTFGGAAEEASKTAAGGFARMKLAIDETKESVGAALLPALQKVLPYMQRAAEWAQDNPQVFTKMALAIAGVATATLAVNAAMATNPYVVMAAGVIAVAVAFDRLANAIGRVSSAAEKLMRFFAPLAKIPQLGILDKFILGKIRGGGNNKTETQTRSTVSAIAAMELVAPSVLPSTPGGAGSAVPGLGAGYATSAAKKATSAAKSAVVVPKGPDGYVGPMGLPEISLANLSLSQIDASIGGTANMPAPDVTINVNGGDPNAVVDALRAYMRQNGSVPIRVSPIG